MDWVGLAKAIAWPVVVSVGFYVLIYTKRGKNIIETIADRIVSVRKDIKAINEDAKSFLDNIKDVKDLDETLKGLHDSVNILQTKLDEIKKTTERTVEKVTLIGDQQNFEVAAEQGVGVVDNQVPPIVQENHVAQPAAGIQPDPVAENGDLAPLQPRQTPLSSVSGSAEEEDVYDQVMNEWNVFLERMESAFVDKARFDRRSIGTMALWLADKRIRKNIPTITSDEADKIGTIFSSIKSMRMLARTQKGRDEILSKKEDADRIISDIKDASKIFISP
jgi:hypothetical protein